MIQKVIPLLFSLWLAVVSVFSGLAAEPSYPPVPYNSFYAEDYTGILHQDTKQKINGIGWALEQKTGAEVAVAIVKSVPDGDIESYANGFFRARGFGDKEKNNGILLLISMDDHRMRVEVGYGLEGALNDAKAGRILDETLVPAFQQGDYNGGVEAAYEALIKVCMKEYNLDSLAVNDDYVLRTSPAQEADLFSPLEMILMGVGLFILIIIDQKFFGGFFTQILLQILMMVLMRGGRGGGFGSRGGGGSAGGGGASRRW